MMGGDEETLASRVRRRNAHGSVWMEDWKDLEPDDWPVLLAGNGASRAVSDAFAYDSVLAAADLDHDDVELFDHLGTLNFEEVLRSLDFARIVHEQLGGDPGDVQGRREAVRHALARR